jgi:hypothetical protein
MFNSNGAALKMIEKYRKGIYLLALGLGWVGVLTGRLEAKEAALTAPLTDESSSQESKGWVAPEEQADENRLVRYLAHFVYVENKGQTAQVSSILDLSVRRKLDQTPWGAIGVLRFRKDFSSADDVTAVELREAKGCFSVSRFQAVLGRMELQPLVTPLSFFGAYPLMGARRVDGMSATLPVFFKFGDREDVSGRSAPLAISFIYSPSLLSAETARMDKTQGFFMGQARCRIGTDQHYAVLRVLGAKTRNALFQYSSFSGNPAGSVSVEWVTRKFYALCGEWSIQNLSKSRETQVAAAGLRLERLATVGSLSLDGLWVEGQWPMKGSSENIFVGGNPYDPTLGEKARFTWFARVKGRLGLLVWEFQATTNRDDFTLGRADGRILGVGIPENLGPGRQSGDAGVPFKTATAKVPAYLMRVGVPF